MSTFVGGNVTNDTTTKARNNAKKNNSHDNNNNNTTTTTSRQFLFLILCFCVPFVCSSPKPFVLHQSSTTPSRGIFSLACRPFGGHRTNDTKLHNTQRIICFQKNDTNVSLSLSVCVFLLEQQQVVLVFLSASKSSSVVRRSSFVVKGKERLKNETLLESCVQTRM